MALRTQARSRDTADLDALFSVGSIEPGTALSGFRLVDPALIVVEKQVRRESLDNEDLDGLAENISQTAKAGGGIGATGILQPLVVAANDNGTYTLKFGHRRHAAAIRLKSGGHLDAVPVYVETTPDNVQTRVVTQISENTQRADLNPLDLTAALRAMRDDWGWSWGEIRERLGYSEKTLKKYANLERLDDDVKAMIRARPDTVSVAEIVQKLPEPERAPFIDRAVAGEGFRQLAPDIQKRTLTLGLKPPRLGEPTPSERRDAVAARLKKARSEMAAIRADLRGLRRECADLITTHGQFADGMKRDIRYEGDGIVKQVEKLVYEIGAGEGE